MIPSAEWEMSSGGVLVPARTPVARWTMDNISGSTLIDEQGSYNGTIVGAVTAAGSVGNSLLFDGGDWVALPSLLNHSSGSILATLKGTGNYLSKSNVTGAANHVFYVSVSGSPARVIVRVKCTTTVTDNTFQSDTTVDTGTFTVIEVGSTGTAYFIKINGEYSAITVTLGVDNGRWMDKVVSTDGTFMGKVRLTGADYGFVGNIDECNIFDEVA